MNALCRLRRLVATNHKVTDFFTPTTKRRGRNLRRGGATQKRGEEEREEKVKFKEKSKEGFQSGACEEEEKEEKEMVKESPVALGWTANGKEEDLQVSKGGTGGGTGEEERERERREGTALKSAERASISMWASVLDACVGSSDLESKANDEEMRK